MFQKTLQNLFYIWAQHQSNRRLKAKHTVGTFSNLLLLLPLSLPFTLVSLGSDKVMSFYASQFP